METLGDSCHCPFSLVAERSARMVREMTDMKIGIGTIVRKKYQVIRRIGEGGFGAIYEAVLFENPQVHVAIKAEPCGAKEEELVKMEVTVLNVLREVNAKHACRLISSGKADNYNYFIMNLLGPSLSDVRKTIRASAARDKEKGAGELTLYSQLMIGIQAVDALKELHCTGYIHRDVKPGNFSVGRLHSEHAHIVFLIDFGMCRNLMYKTEDGARKLREPRRQVVFKGTMRYMSPNCHRQEDPYKHDDLWSLLYSLIEIFHGDLPWKAMEKEATRQCKEDSEADLLKPMPPEYTIIVAHLKKLAYGREPDYALIRACFAQVYHRNGYGKGRVLDWVRGGKYAHLFPGCGTLTTALDNHAQKHMKHLVCEGVRKKDDAQPAMVVEVPAPDSEIKLEAVEEDPRQEDNSNHSRSNVDDTLEQVDDMKRAENSQSEIDHNNNTERTQFSIKDLLRRRSKERDNDDNDN